jgi:RNA polymerase sigma-B factor
MTPPTFVETTSSVSHTVGSGVARLLATEVPRETRRVETTRLFGEAASCPKTERDQLIEQIIILNVGVARSIARRYAGRGLALDDLESVGYMALVRAARKFDGDRAEDFLTYAVPTIRGEIKRHFRDHGWMVRPTRRIQELQTTVLRVRDSLRESTGRSPSEAEIATELDVPEADVAEALQAEGCFTPLSLDMRVSAGDPGAMTLGEVLPSVDGDLSAAEARSMLAPALAKLTERERVIVRLRFVEDRTQSEIGTEIGVTQMQVSRLLSAILRKLREGLTAGDADQPVDKHVDKQDEHTTVAA